MIRNNYDTLTLKLQDGLDQHDKYSEKPKESPYFSQLVGRALRMHQHKICHSVILSFMLFFSLYCNLLPFFSGEEYN